MLRDRADAFALLFCLLFVALGSLWLSEVGIQNDEALFSAGIYPPFGNASRLMVMTYVGALKSHLYVPIFKMWPPSAASIRFPALILGALTVWLFYLLVKRTLGRTAALIATALLATDTTFLLTTRWDWGPVVLQHLLLVAGLTSIIGFVSSSRVRWLALGFFLFGLGVWDKAIFLWSVVGLGVAAMAVFPRQFVHFLRVKTVAIATAAFLLGAAPFLAFNLRFNWITFRQNAAWSTEILGYKADLLRSTLNGSAVLGTVPRDDWDGPIREPDDPFKRALVSASRAVGSPRENLQFPLLILTILLLPIAWRTSARPAFLSCPYVCSGYMGTDGIHQECGDGCSSSDSDVADALSRNRSGAR
jgi:4-amino-4-deoxy-L-arabinose transferase-like glycosyltransferase